jgi:hypothetical protein
VPPHSGQVSISIANTRLRRCIQVMGALGLSLSNLPLRRFILVYFVTEFQFNNKVAGAGEMF